MKNAGVLQTHAKLLRSVWRLEYGGELEYLRTCTCALRKKIEKNPANPEYILNEPCVGYRFRIPEYSESPAFQVEQTAAPNSAPTMRCAVRSIPVYDIPDLSGSWQPKEGRWATFSTLAEGIG